MTPHIDSMTPEEMRVKCAELAGWSQIQIQLIDFLTIDGGGEREGLCGKYRNRPVRDEVLDYPSDLNAVHELEKTLTEEEREVYLGALVAVAVCPLDDELGRDLKHNEVAWVFVSATALHRVKAFLITKGAATL